MKLGKNNQKSLEKHFYMLIQKIQSILWNSRENNAFLPFFKLNCENLAKIAGKACFHADSDEFRSNSAKILRKRLFAFFDETGKIHQKS